MNEIIIPLKEKRKTVVLDGPARERFLANVFGVNSSEEIKRITEQVRRATEAPGHKEIYISNGGVIRIKCGKRTFMINGKARRTRQVISRALPTQAVAHRARARSYRSLTRNASNSNAAHDDGGGGDDGGSDSEPAKPYHPHVTPPKFQQNSNSLAVNKSRLMIHGFRKEAAA